jgi:phosphoserine phosphatase
MALVMAVAGWSCGPSVAETFLRLDHSGIGASIRQPGLEAAPSGEPLLSHRHFGPDARATLEATIRAHGRPHLPADERPAVVVLLEYVAWDGDPGLAVFEHVVANMAFVVDEAFFQSIPFWAGRDELRRAHELLSASEAAAMGEERDEGRRQALHAWHDGLRRVERRLRWREGGEPACLFRAQLLRGLFAADVTALAEAAFEDSDALFEPAPTRRRGRAREPQAAEEAEAGRWFTNRPRAAVRELISGFQRWGFDVWIVSRLNQRVAEAAAARLGVPAHRVLGLKTHRDEEGRLTSDFEPPVTCGGRRTSDLRRALGRQPVAVVAGAPADRDLLAVASVLRMVVDVGDPALKRVAEEEGWLLLTIANGQRSAPPAQGLQPAGATSEERTSP